MENVKWFDRKFKFPEQNIFPSILGRLAAMPTAYEKSVKNLNKELTEKRLNNGWSIKENIGHIIDLEPIWLGRLQDILEGNEYMRPADLSNSKTHLANHNNREIHELLLALKEIRNKTTDRLASLTTEEIYRSAKHPRLHQEMRIMDLFYFVVEHDDHHLKTIKYLIESF